MSAEIRDAQEGPFEDWWTREGQYLRAGGDSYSKTFAWHAWCEATARAAQAQAAEPLTDAARYQALRGTLGTRSFTYAPRIMDPWNDQVTYAPEGLDKVCDQMLADLADKP
jgi:hypothetical protein